jgi:NAD+ synthase
MPEIVSLALAQLNPAVGDIAGNTLRLRAAREAAAKAGAHLLMTPELYLCGYPPEDLVLKPSFQKAVRKAVEALAKETADGGPAILLGAPWREKEKLYNAVLLLSEGRIAAKVFKTDLPNYGPFDEKRVFTSAPPADPIEFRGMKLGVLICEDLWTPPAALHAKQKGAQILLVPNGSPYESDKHNERQALMQVRVKETGLPLVYLNQVGGQDELVFDGASFILDAEGTCIAEAKAWSEDLILASFDGSKVRGGELHHTSVTDASQIYHALMLGLRDYVTKNGFPGVVLGLSGGVDSALVASLAVDALGADKVWAVMMPSPFTAQESKEDAAAVAKLLKCRLDSIPITAAMDVFTATLHPVFKDKPFDTTEENIQARIRGMILMALSNKFGPMVISSGNKSEMSVGYSTLYGDMCGGFAVLKDVYKTQVYNVAHWRNAHKPASALGPEGRVIPERILTRAPTAELRPDQKDQDTLPPYEVLDDILECLVEKDLGMAEITACGHDAVIVKRVWEMLDRAEYKRRQAPPGVKITRRHLGKDRRYPITNRYKE